MRDCLGAPLEYDSRKHGYYFSDPGWTLPKVELTELEVLNVLLAEQMARQYSGTPVADVLDSVFEKLKGVLNEPVTIDPALIERNFSFYGSPNRPISERVWIPLFRALRERRTIQFEYSSVSSGNHGLREVEPLHLACLTSEWYLVAFDTEKVGIRQYAVSRIKGTPNITDNYFDRDFDAETYFSNRFNRFVGQNGTSYQVGIRFSRTVAHWILERIWHPEQKTQKHRDGSLTLSFPTPSLYEVKRWVLQWGSDAKVLGPKELVDAHRDEIAAMQSIYSL